MIDGRQSLSALNGSPPAIVATNAAGAATFKDGSVRDWVEAMTIVLADGATLELERGRRFAVDGRITLDSSRGQIIVPVPTYSMPRVAKRSAGYFAAPDMDAIDLFIGSEGTLGVITRITIRTLTPAPNVVFALVPCHSEAQALDLVGSLRSASIHTWHTRDADGIDVCAIEHMDAR
jgi:D-lactate dehydrogenase (cytochrome)